MKVLKRRVPPLAEIEEDLGRLEIGIRQLRVQYEMYFAGGLKREPLLLRGSVQKIIKRYNEIAMPKVSMRFRFSSLVSRYAIFCELWGKKLREMEEGVRRPVRIGGPEEQTVATCRLAAPGEDAVSLRDLHLRYMNARRAAGQGDTEISYERFERSVAAQTRQIQEKSGCSEVEFRVVVHGDSVQVRARPAKH